jgi:hypothetical protein
MDPVATSPAVSFPLREVLSDAFASVRADLGAHLGWNETAALARTFE